MRRKTANSPELPFWYQPGAAPGSAVRYLASFSSKFSWVGIRIREGKRLIPGPTLGAPILINDAKSQLVVLIRDRQGGILGEIVIDSRVSDAFGPEEEAAVRRVAEELGTLWSE